MNIVNLTEKVRIFNKIEIQPSGDKAKIILGIMVGLPGAKPNTVYLVDLDVRNALGNDRPDVYSPGPHRLIGI